MVRAVCLIPGASEFGYDTMPVTQVLGLGETRPENRHQLQRATRCGGLPRCAAGPVPEPQARLARGELVRRRPARRLLHRRAAGGRDDQDHRRRHLVRRRADARRTRRRCPSPTASPAYGGTPSDESVIRLIQAPEGARARGRALSLRDDGRARRQRPAGSLWRHRPAGLSLARAHHLPSRAGQGRLARRHQLRRQRRSNAWFTRGCGLQPHGPALCAISRRRRAASTASSSAASSSASRACARRSGVYPAVARLRALAAEVRAILRASHRRSSMRPTGRNTARMCSTAATRCAFPSIRSSPHDDIDAVGIDYYPPISDWRDGARPRGSGGGAQRLRRRLSARAARQRRGLRLVLCQCVRARTRRRARPITDGAYGKPWVFRQKDLVSWWSNRHVERVGGVEIGATAWLPQSKPIWLTEIGIPAVDKGPNGPNVFPDPKSSESAYPPFSRGVRDDLVQARALEAILSRFDPALSAASRPAYNPVSPSYGGRMVDPDNVFVWAWDARPFPGLSRFRHRVGGRRQLGDRPLDHRPDRGRAARPADRRASCSDFGFADPGPIPVDGFVDGYVIDRPDVGARRARAAAAPVRRRCGGARRRASRGSGRGGRAVAAPDEGRSRARATSEPSLQAHPRAGDRAAAAGGGRLHRRRDGLSPRRRGLAPPVRREPARGAGGRRRRHPPRRGAAPRRYLAAGSVGRAREAPSSSCRPGASSSSRAT